jgi:hypothetical protein
MIKNSDLITSYLDKKWFEVAGSGVKVVKIEILKVDFNDETVKARISGNIEVLTFDGFIDMYHPFEEVIGD